MRCVPGLGLPTLYDTTLRIIEKIKSKGNIAIEMPAIPGISSVQALAAKHRIALNRIGEPVHITTGRKLAEGFPATADTVSWSCSTERQAFKAIESAGVDIYWGAYIGTRKDEEFRIRTVVDVGDRIEVVVRAQARRQKGWIMDTYLLRSSV